MQKSVPKLPSIVFYLFLYFVIGSRYIFSALQFFLFFFWSSEILYFLCKKSSPASFELCVIVQIQHHSVPFSAGEKRISSFPAYIHSRSGQIVGSVKDLLWDVDSWARSTGPWVSDTMRRLLKRTGVISGHLLRASVARNMSQLQLFLRLVLWLLCCLFSW